MDWWRAYHGISTDPKYQVVLRHIASHRVTSRHTESPEIRLSDITAIWLWLLDFASQSSPRGSIEGVQIDHISIATGLTDEAVETVLDGFRWRKMITGNSLTAFEKRQPSSTFRMQEKRARDSASHGVTSRHVESQSVTPLARDARSKSSSCSLSTTTGTEESSVNRKTNSEPEFLSGALNGGTVHDRYSYLRDESYKQFVVLACQFWPDVIEDDLQKSFDVQWRYFDFQKKLEVVKRLKERIDAGEDGCYVSRPPKYLEGGNWRRPPRIPKNGHIPTQGDQKSKYQPIEIPLPPED